MNSPPTITKTKTHTKTIIGWALVGGAIVAAAFMMKKNIYKVQVVPGDTPTTPPASSAIDLKIANIYNATDCGTIRSAVQNAESGAAMPAGGFELQYEWKDANDTSLGTGSVNIPSLAGNSFTAVYSGVAPQGAAAIVLTVDPNNTVSETNATGDAENNNTLTFTASADLPLSTLGQRAQDNKDCLNITSDSNQVVATGATTTATITTSTKQLSGLLPLTGGNVLFSADFSQAPGLSGGTFTPSSTCSFDVPGTTKTCSRTLNLTAGQTVSPGRYPVTVLASSGPIQRQAPVYVCVGLPTTQCADDLVLAFGQTSVTAAKNTLAANTLQAQLSGVANGTAVNFDVPLQPPTSITSGISLSPASCTVTGGSCSINLTAFIKNTAPSGQYNVTVQATGAGVTKTASFTLVVQ